MATQSVVEASLNVIEKLNAIFDEQHLFADQDKITQYGLALNGSECLPLAIVLPTNEQQVIDLINLANQEKLVIHPLARGKNWGYGTAQGTSAGQLILDFSRFNQIEELNEDLAYVRVRPGISQQGLYEHLERNNSKLQLDITAAGKNASVVGNILERGFGHTDYSDRFANVLAMKVLLPNGEVIHTGMNMFEGSIAQHVYPYGIGPVTHGLFSQSNLGIVLEMTIALQPKPDFFATLIITTNDANAAPDMVHCIAELKMKGVITSGVHTASMARAVGEQSVKMAGQWVATASVSGPKSIAMARYKEIKKAIKKAVPKSRVMLMTDFRARVLRKINTFAKSESLSGLELVLDLKKGIPTDQPMKTLLEDKNARSTMKTEEFPAYFRWICAVSTFKKEDTQKMLDICKTVFEKYDYEQRYTMTNVSARAVVLIANIRYGKTDVDIEKAKRFYHELDQELISQGFCPYRSGSGMFDAAKEHVDQNNIQLLKQLKKTLDPNQILSPGKYWI